MEDRVGGQEGRRKERKDRHYLVLLWAGPKIFLEYSYERGLGYSMCSLYLSRSLYERDNTFSGLLGCA